MSNTNKNHIIDEVQKLTLTAFESPLWDNDEKKWFRIMNMESGEVDTNIHYYYDLCNIYSLARTMRIIPELSRFETQWLDAVNWLFWLLINNPEIGYNSLGVKHSRDQYSFALSPSVLAEAYLRTDRKALLEKAIELFANYRTKLPAATSMNVQASNHIILSALSLFKVTNDVRFLNDAIKEGKFLFEKCRFEDGPAQGCFTDDFTVTAFPRHCYGAWALMELNRWTNEYDWVGIAEKSLKWWQDRQLPNGGFYFFFNAKENEWSDKTVYSVHQKGMLLLSAWDINRETGGRYSDMIKRAMSCCDNSDWEFTSPQNWNCWRRSNQEPQVVYSYELGWEILGHALAIGSD